MSSHGWNQYENHVHQMDLWISNYHDRFDFSAPPQQVSRDDKTLIDANELHRSKSSQCALNKEDIFFGVFIFKGLTGRAIRIIIQKKLAIDKVSQVIKSKTTNYKYIISWDTSIKDKHVTRFLRFDNSPHWNHPTHNHFHVELRFHRNKKKDQVPSPVHIGENYPHISDIFEIADIFKDEENLNKIHDRYIYYFSNLTTNNKVDMAKWYPGLSKIFPLPFLRKLEVTGRAKS